MLEQEVARMISVVAENGRVLSHNTEYGLNPNNTIELPIGAYEITYSAFPNLKSRNEALPIPLPRMFQEAVHWYVCYAYHARLIGESNTETQYYQVAFNNACREAEHFYAAQTRPRRMPCRKIR
jgi:hypothetical protein